MGNTITPRHVDPTVKEPSYAPTGQPSKAAHYTTLGALAVAILVAIMPPALHFHFGKQYLQGHEAAEAELSARLVTELVGVNPTMWEFETLRLEALVGADEGENERAIIRNASGNEVLVSGNTHIARPIVSTAAPIYDSGVIVGEVIISKSLRETLYVSLMIFALSATLAAGAFIVLRTLPLRLLKNATDRASFLASHDPLTGLPNRTLFNEWLLHSVGDIDRAGGYMAVLCLDLDHFKEVNDLLGHAAGDNLLRQVTERMTSSLRRNDILARLGGDEFAIIQKHVDQPDGATKLADRLISDLSKPFDLEGNEVLVGLSVGIALRHGKEKGQDRNGQSLLQQADLALYKAKGDGRGTYRFFEEEMNEKLISRKRMEADLRQAIARNELELHYQPQIDLNGNGIKGVEALIRWRRKEQGLICPDDFIHLAEETGLIVPIGEWVIREACRQAKDWPELSFAVNVSPVQFRQGNLVETVKNALRDEGADAHRLELEITESVLLSHTDETIETLRALQAMGVRIAMDDFGTGYSSLSYLRRFPFDKIKIDKSFVNDLGTSADADSIIEAVIGLGASMGMTSNAEGVETAEQVKLLRQRGCNEVQGFFFSKPLPSASVAELLDDWEWSNRGSTEKIPVQKAN
ncbi:MAG: EAL domain-containing protein [Silicimonas sp.]|nr:EAL domain-containing protein [Silicimonas sp.]